MTYQELKELYERCTAGNCTPAEQKLFEEYRDSFDLSDIPWLPAFGDQEVIGKQLKDDLHKRLYKPKVKISKRFYWAAAALIVMLAGAFLYSAKYFTAKKDAPLKLTQNTNSIKHGSDKAMLTLSDGRRITLDDSKKGILSTQSNVSVAKDKTGRVVYKKDGVQGSAAAQTFNTMTTPRGGKYELMLSDGTRVWLNAATSLRYPVDFAGDERMVELSGEAYFEVAHNAAKPFKVISNGQTVQVLGTHFNINAYPDEEAIKTTLLEGSVRVFSSSPEKGALVIKPDEQAVFKNDQFSKATVDADEVIAWKNGFILFKNADIKSIMRQISRWYDVDVVYQGHIAEDAYSGEISRNADLAEVFKILKLSDINLKVNGRTVIVSP